MNRFARQFTNRLTDRLATLFALSLTGAVGAATLAAPPQTPIEEIKASIAVFEAARTDHLRTNEFAQALARIVADNPEGGEMKAANAQIAEASFGQSFEIGTSGFGTVPEAFPAVFTANGGVSLVEDLYILPIDAAWMPAGSLPVGTSAFIYSANFGDGPDHVGFGTIIDRWSVGAAAGPDESYRHVISFAPIDLIDPSGPVTGPDAVQFLQGTLSGVFDAEGSLHAWMLAKVTEELAEGDLNDVAPGCNRDALLECLTDARSNRDQCLEGLRPLAGQITELEKKLVESGRKLAEGVVAGAVAGALEGAITGSLASGPGAVMGALVGAISGAIGALVSWLFFDDADENAEKLEILYEQMKSRICGCYREWAGRAKQCFSIFCPDHAAEAGSLIDAGLERVGC